jgi:hypothetical protein
MHYATIGSFIFSPALIVLTAVSLAGVHVSAATVPHQQNSSSMLHVSGKLHFGEQTARMTHLYFCRKTSDEGPVLALLFSDHPLPARALDDRQKLAELARSRAFMGLSVELDGSGSVQTTDLYHDDGGFSGTWYFESAKGKETITAGRIATDEEREFFGKTYSVDVTFDVGAKADDTWRGSPFYEAKPTGLAVGRAEGWMERLGQKTDLSHALAVSETDLFGDSGERKLFLTAVPMTEEMLTAGMGPEQAMHQAGVAFLRISLDSQNEIQSVMVPSGDGNPMNFSSTQWSIEFAESPPTELDGRAVLKASGDSDGEFPRFDLRFHASSRNIGAVAPVTAENGSALPKDGGEAGKVYRNFLNALKKAKTVDELIPLRIASMAKMIDELPLDQRAQVLEFLKQEAQTPYKIVGGFANDEQATLWLEAGSGDQRIDGRVNVHKEAGTWKLGMEAFRAVPDDAQ